GSRGWRLGGYEANLSVWQWLARCIDDDDRIDKPTRPSHAALGGNVIRRGHLFKLRHCKLGGPVAISKARARCQAQHFTDVLMMWSIARVIKPLHRAKYSCGQILFRQRGPCLGEPSQDAWLKLHDIGRDAFPGELTEDERRKLQHHGRHEIADPSGVRRRHTCNHSVVGVFNEFLKAFTFCDKMLPVGVKNCFW